jgi:hypothetical protein
MSFDISRVTFNPWKDLNGVVMQQGRVQLDSDWNEGLAELMRRIRAGTYDCFGPTAVYPSTTPEAFHITTPTAGSISIGVGRMYVDGLLAENHGSPAPESGGWIPPNPAAPGAQPDWDPALDELVGKNALDYLQQPYFPGIATQAAFPTSGGPFIVYLDVWQRCLTFLEDPDVVEKAVSVDTTGRIQTVWQVRLLNVGSTTGVTCTTPDKDIPAWSALIEPSAGRLSTGVVQSSPSGPCCLAPNTGYTGMENQLYRVEIHQPGTSTSGATFKWSRNNANIAAPVLGISQGGTVLAVQSTGRDNVLRFNANDWVEITDDWLELNGQQGELRQILQVTDSNNTIKLSAALPGANFPVDANGLTDPNRHTRVIKWDQGGKVFESDGTTVWTDLDAATSNGDIPVPPPGTSLILENGITVTFDLNPGTGKFHISDYWNFAARTVDGTTEKLVEAPPLGIHHHYARLALLTLPDVVNDCRVEWPPKSTGGETGCDCQACVTAESHNGNTWTIQQAIDFVLTHGGGKVCLGPGIYNIASTINIGGGNVPAVNLAIEGHGLPTLVPTIQFQGNTIMRVRNAIDIDIDAIAFSGGATFSDTATFSSGPVGLTIGQSAYVRVERCAFGIPTDIRQLSAGIALADLAVVNCTLRQNLFSNVDTGVGVRAERLVLMQFLAVENQFYCTNGAFACAGPSGLLASEVRFANNFVQAGSGFVLLGTGLDVVVESNTFQITAATASDKTPYDAAVVCNLAQTRVLNNEITRTSSDLNINTTANNNGVLTAGTYSWLVTAVLANGREALLTSAATATLASPSNAKLSWGAVAGAKGYRVYRTVANGGVFLLSGNAPQTGGTTISYDDSVADAGLQDQLPAMQNDGIVIGGSTPTFGTTSLPTDAAAPAIYGTQIVGNRISALIGTGILSPNGSFLLATLIAQNQMTALGGDGILLAGNNIDLDIIENSLLSVAQLPREVKELAGIQVTSTMNANISENRVAQLGPQTSDTGAVRRAIYVTFGLDVRIAGNQITDNGPTASPSLGIIATSIGRLDINDNNVRRATVPPAKLDKSTWLALEAKGDVISVEDNLFESFGGSPKVPGTVGIVALQTCTFSNNQCFLDDPAGGPPLVVEVEAPSIIAMGNRVKGPVNTLGTAAFVSMLLLVPGDKPPVTVIGNITSAGIKVQPGGIPAAMVPLNITA